MLYMADEIFFTGTAAEVTPIREVDNRIIGTGKKGPVTARLQALFFEQVNGQRSQHPEWLTYINDINEASENRDDKLKSWA